MQFKAAALVLFLTPLALTAPTENDASADVLACKPGTYRCAYQDSITSSIEVCAGGRWVPSARCAMHRLSSTIINESGKAKKRTLLYNQGCKTGDRHRGDDFASWNAFHTEYAFRKSQRWEKYRHIDTIARYHSILISDINKQVDEISI
ncbi:hypothetical protein I7I51_02315, partial [Histoplasma capsulatum]